MKEPPSRSLSSYPSSHHNSHRNRDKSKDFSMSSSHTHNRGKDKEKELDKRRERGEVSCAECRRLKLRCDRKLPCTSCTRRGCSSICPTGSLIQGSGTRFVLASTSLLHQKLHAMSARIRLLEDALEVEHAANISLSLDLQAMGGGGGSEGWRKGRHPLLVGEGMEVKMGVEGLLSGGDSGDAEDGGKGAEKREKRGEEEEEEMLEKGFGLMSIGEGGEMTFYGRAANEAMLMHANDHEVSESEQEQDDADAEEEDELASNIVTHPQPPPTAHIPVSVPSLSSSFTPMHSLSDFYQSSSSHIPTATATASSISQTFPAFQNRFPNPLPRHQPSHAHPHPHPYPSAHYSAEPVHAHSPPRPKLSTKATLLLALESRLPSYARATALLEAYLQHIAGFAMFVAREQAIEDLLVSFYKDRPSSNTHSTQPYNEKPPLTQSRLQSLESLSSSPTYTHRLSLLFSLLALGAIGDLTLPLPNTEAHSYHRYATVGLSINGVYGGGFGGLKEVLEFLGEVEGEFTFGGGMKGDGIGIGSMRWVEGELGFGSEAGSGTANGFGNGKVPTNTPSATRKRTISVSNTYGIEAVQLIMTYAMYELISGSNTNLESVWRLMTVGMGLASGMGLHRDPGLWGMPAKMAQRRRTLFWEIFMIDKVKSLEAGRPATFNLSDIDCNFPEDTEATLDKDGRLIESALHYKYRFSRFVTAPIAERMCAIKPIRYSEILELDRMIREFELPAGWSTPSPDVDTESTPTATPHSPSSDPIPEGVNNEKPSQNSSVSSFHRYNIATFREIALLFVHRHFFARAMLDSPLKPLSTPFASSAIAAYASAVSLLKNVRAYFESYKEMVVRQWLTWAHALTAAVIVGSVACRGPLSYITSSALKELDAAVELFTQAQEHPIARRSLPLLLRLQAHSHHAMHRDPSFAMTQPGAREELKILYGATTYLQHRDRPSSSAPGSSKNGGSKSGSRTKGRKGAPRQGSVSVSVSASGRCSGESTPTATHSNSGSGSAGSPDEMALPGYEKTRTTSDPTLAASDMSWSMFAPPPPPAASSQTHTSSFGTTTTTTTTTTCPQTQMHPSTSTSKPKSTAPPSFFNVDIDASPSPFFNAHASNSTSTSQSQNSRNSTPLSRSPSTPQDPAYSLAMKQNAAAIPRLMQDLPGVFSPSAETKTKAQSQDLKGGGLGMGSEMELEREAWDSTSWIKALSSNISGALEDIDIDTDTQRFGMGFEPSNFFGFGSSSNANVSGADAGSKETSNVSVSGDGLNSASTNVGENMNKNDFEKGGRFSNSNPPPYPDSYPAPYPYSWYTASTASSANDMSAAAGPAPGAWSNDSSSVSNNTANPPQTQTQPTFPTPNFNVTSHANRDADAEIDLDALMMDWTTDADVTLRESGVEGFKGLNEFLLCQFPPHPPLSSINTEAPDGFGYNFGVGDEDGVDGVGAADGGDGGMSMNAESWKAAMGL